MTSNDEAILSIDTLMHYGLKQQPFAAEAPDAYIYSDPALDMPVNAALNFLQTEDHIVLLKGEYGIGKTTHIKKLITRSRGTLTPCQFNANISTSLAEIEHSMRQCWPIEAQQQDLTQFLANAQKKGIRPVLIIDDAHDLDVDVLEQLLLIRRDVKDLCGRAFGLLLVGESSIEHTLSSLEADIPEISHSHSLVLRPLTREQVHAYIDHRMRIAGMFMTSPYTAEAIEDIVQATHGLPGDINPTATRFLESQGQAILHREHTNRPGWIHHNRVPLTIIVVASIALVGIITLIHGLFFSEEPDSKRKTRVISTPLPESAEPAEVATTLPESISSVPEEPALDSELTDPVTKLVPAPETTAQEQATQSSPVPEQSIATETLPPVTSINASSDQTSEVKNDTAAPTLPSGSESTQPVQESQVEADTPQKSALSPASSTLKGPNWILGINQELFAAQLLAVSSLEALEKAASDLEIGAELAYYTRSKDKKTLYILIAAPYKDRAATEKAIAEYPDSLRRSKPWIRPIKDIQDTIYAQ